MSNGLSDNLKAAGNKLKGEAKETVGNVTNDPKLQTEGKLDKAKGAIQEKIADVKEAISDKLNNDDKS